MRYDLKGINTHIMVSDVKQYTADHGGPVYHPNCWAVRVLLRYTAAPSTSKAWDQLPSTASARRVTAGGCRPKRLKCWHSSGPVFAQRLTVAKIGKPMQFVL